MAAPPLSAVAAITGPSTRPIRRVEIYEADGTTRWAGDTQVLLKEGNVTVDYSRDERRAIDLVLDNAEGTIVTDPTAFWYDKIIKVFHGVYVGEVARPPKVIIIEDTGDGSSALALRNSLIAAGIDNVLINTLATTLADLAGYEVVVALGVTTKITKYALLQSAYALGYRIFTNGSTSTATEIPFFTSTATKPTVPTVTRTNLVKNPSLELDVTGWGFIPGTGGAATAGVTRSTTTPSVGAANARVTWTTATTAASGGINVDGRLSSARPINVVAGRFYGIRAMVRGSKAQTYSVGVEWYNASNVKIGASQFGSNTAATVNTWTALSGTFTAPALAVSMIVTVYVVSGVVWAVGDTMDVDAVLVEEVATSGTAPGVYFDGSTGVVSTVDHRWQGVTGASRSEEFTFATYPPYTATPQSNLSSELTTGWTELVGLTSATGTYPTALRSSAMKIGGLLRDKTNFITNSTFETNTTGWTVIGSGGATQNVLVRDNITTPLGGPAFHGDYYGKITWGNNTSGGSGISTTITGLVPGKTYTFAVGVFVPSTNGQFISITSPSGVTGLNTTTAPNNSDTTAFPLGQWNNLTWTVVAGTSGTVTLQILSTDQTATALNKVTYIDRIIFTETETYTPGDYFDGDYGFGYTWDGTADNSVSRYTAMPTLVAELNPNGSGGRWIHHQNGTIQSNMNLFAAVGFTWLNPYVPVVSWETQTGEFMIDRISEAHFPHTLAVTGRDYTKKCLVSKFTQATAFAKNSAVEATIRTIATNAGVSKFRIPSNNKLLGKDFVWERGVDRWAAMKDLATAYNYEMFFDAEGYLVLREYQDPLTSPIVLQLETGANSNLAGFSVSTNDSRLYNHIVVTGETSDASVTPVFAEAINTQPNSPSRVAKIGDRVYQYTSAFITTTQQAQDVANSFLKVHALEEYELSFSSLVFAWMEVGNIIRFLDPRASAGDPDLFLLTQLTIPLQLGTMSGTGKRIALVG